MKNKKSALVSKIRTVFEGKRVYIALASLVLLIGFSIYARQILTKNKTNNLTFDEEAWHQALTESGIEFKENGSEDEATEQEAEETLSAVIPVNESDEIPVSESVPDTETETSVSVSPQFDYENMQMPCQGEILEDCSLDNLIYCSTMDDWRTHNGIDIAAVEGTPVVATAPGTVCRVYDDEMLGVVVEIDHGNNVTSLYANLQSTEFIHAGTAVNAGDIIGGIGKPGALEADKEPHLHFEIYKDNELQNPNNYIFS